MCCRWTRHAATTCSTSAPSWNPGNIAGTLPFNSDAEACQFGGRNYVRVPCAPPSTVSSTIGGGYLDGELATTLAPRAVNRESGDYRRVTKDFSDSGDPLDVGIVGRYNFKPWNDNIATGPFAALDYLNQTIKHNFAGGQRVGILNKSFIDAGVKGGVITAQGAPLRRCW